MTAEPQFKSSKDIPPEQIYMTTSQGLFFHHFVPKPEEMNILDIAKALSQNCRYNGHTPFHYSVAQHSVYVDDLLVKMFPDVDIKTRRTALMHDCPETWLPDVHSAVKHKFPEYMRVSAVIEKMAAEKFDLIYPEPPRVKLADGVILSTELVKLMKSQPHIERPLLDFEIKRMSCEKAELLFLKRWEQLKP